MSAKFSAVCVVVSLALWACCHCEPIFHNQFAVHVPAGEEIADSIAAKHGFTNLGKVSEGCTLQVSW